MMNSDQRFVVVLCGCTGTGKSDLGIEIAKAFNGEVISADSMQIYKGLSIIFRSPRSLEKYCEELWVRGSFCFGAELICFYCSKIIFNAFLFLKYSSNFRFNFFETNNFQVWILPPIRLQRRRCKAFRII